MNQLPEWLRSFVQLRGTQFLLLIAIHVIGGAVVPFATVLALGAPLSQAVRPVLIGFGALSLFNSLLFLAAALGEAMLTRSAKHRRLIRNHPDVQSEPQRASSARRVSRFRAQWILPGRAWGPTGALCLSGDTLLFISSSKHGFGKWPVRSILDCIVGHSGTAAILLLIRLEDGSEVLFETLEPQGWSDTIHAARQHAMA